MSRFVRASNYRHVYGQNSSGKKENCYDNIKISASAWDTNLVSASAKYLAVNYQSSGGGAFLVTPLDTTGKLPDLFPLCRAHTAPVLDTDWSPFNDSLIASAGEDGRVALTLVDESILREALSNDNKSEIRDLEPTVKLSGHGRKAGHVKWHPTADGILASASNEVKVWDTQNEKSIFTSEAHGDMVQSMDWDYNGTVVATTCKDKKLRLFDPRAGSAPITIVDGHQGIKGSRAIFLGSHDRIVTTGFSKTSERQVYLWDSRDLGKGPLKQINLDSSSGVLMPFYSAGNSILWLAGKGDGNVRYYEHDASDELFALSEYTSNTPQRGMTLLPARALKTSENEIARAFKATGSMIEPISFIVPRKSESWQSDLFPSAKSDQPSLKASEWLAGETKAPVLVDLESGKIEGSGGKKVERIDYTSSSTTTAVTGGQVKKEETKKAESTPPPRQMTPPPPTPAPAPVQTREASPPPAPASVQAKEPESNIAAPIQSIQHTNGFSTERDSESNTSERIEELEKENFRLKEEVSERDTLIRELELKLERIKAAFN